MAGKSKTNLLNTILDTWRRLGGRISIIPKGPKQGLIVAVIAAVLGGGVWFLGDNSADEIAKEITVEVTGAVHDPGLFTLSEGSRTGDAIAAAGGFASDADTADLNRAAILADGQQVVVPFTPPDEPEEGSDELDASDSVTADASSTVDPSVVNPIADGSNDAASSLVNINTADEHALQELPNIGPVLARRIIDYREKNGLFATIDDIQKVEGIGSATFAKLVALVSV